MHATNAQAQVPGNPDAHHSSFHMASALSGTAGPDRSPSVLVIICALMTISLHVAVGQDATYGCVYGQASSCAATCGVPGVTIRTATCMSYTGGSTVGVPVTTSNFGNFAGCGNCVSQTSPCPPVPACVNYVCSIGAYSACSVTCGAGVQTRAVQCLAQGGGQTGQAVSLSLCPGGTCQGALTQPCTMCPSNTGFNTGFITPTFTTPTFNTGFIAPQVVNTGGFVWTHTWCRVER